MKIINDSISHPMRFDFGDKILGLYYNSRDKKYHLCHWIPYTGGPEKYLCGETGNFSSSRGPLNKRECCSSCFEVLKDEI